jgi:pyrrolysine biosynthesis protein PylC
VALHCLEQASAEAGVPLIYDPKAYAVSSSKKRSDALFVQYGLPVPRAWPYCQTPLIAKPSGLSGSRGVRRLDTLEELNAFLADHELEEWVIQEFLEGPSYSIEVIGYRGSFAALQVTDLEMDPAYDCKRVTAPTALSTEMQRQFEDSAITIAKALDLHGIMDVEVILHQGELKILEIDARLPSQTPTVVAKSSGLNMLELLATVFLHQNLPHVARAGSKGVVYEHIRVSRRVLEVLGEHVMAITEPLYLRKDFFGADEALTNFSPGRPEWVATLIVVAETFAEAWAKRCAVIEEIISACDIVEYFDRGRDR